MSDANIKCSTFHDSCKTADDQSEKTLSSCPHIPCVQYPPAQQPHMACADLGFHHQFTLLPLGVH